MQSKLFIKCKLILALIVDDFMDAMIYYTIFTAALLYAVLAGFQLNALASFGAIFVDGEKKALQIKDDNYNGNYSYDVLIIIIL